jgi:spore maturation protein CgeB
MVEKFNEYKMFLCPEEIVGMPGIGFVEGMACGCAYIGLDSDMYKCLGLVPGKHYIPYDGTLDDLRRKCMYYIYHTDEAEKIAKEGCAFVREHFNCEKVAGDFFNEITR